MQMERLIEHIERLLLWHDCVIIPDFGGFFLQAVSSACMCDEHLFIPTRKEILFNPMLIHNDGLLTESYMQELAVNFSEAHEQVCTDVTAMKERLDDDLQIKFGRIGLFIKEDGRIVFIPSKNSDELFCTSSYGLPVFYYLSLATRRLSVHNASTADLSGEICSQTDHGSDSPESNHVLYTIPVTRAFVHVFAAAVAAVVLFLLISTPVKDVNRASYSASFVPKEIMSKNAADKVVSGAFTDKAVPGVEANDAAMNERETGARAEAKIESPAMKDAAAETKRGKAASTLSSTKSQASSLTKSGTTSVTGLPAVSATKSSAVAGRYYVIIGSFNTRTQAQRYINRLKGDVAGSAGILAGDGKVRVYAQQFSGERPALAYLSKIRQNPGHQQAWLYKRQ